eukprot:COSAG02_NODE_5661_length_4146_cov_38.400049_3_plen_95_part_00
MSWCTRSTRCARAGVKIRTASCAVNTARREKATVLTCTAWSAGGPSVAIVIDLASRASKAARFLLWGIIAWITCCAFRSCVLIQVDEPSGTWRA